jgi:hypothetical protein
VRFENYGHLLDEVKCHFSHSIDRLRQDQLFGLKRVGSGLLDPAAILSLARSRQI